MRSRTEKIESPAHTPAQGPHTKKGFRNMNPKSLKLLVPEARLELAQAEARGILSPLRLPVPPLRHAHIFYLSPSGLGKCFCMGSTVKLNFPVISAACFSFASRLWDFWKNSNSL
jgi:hypothetical protein